MTERTVSTAEKPESAGQARALGLFLLKRFEEAAAVYDKLLEKEPDNTVFWANRMICRLQYLSVSASFFNEMIRRVQTLPSQGYLCLSEILNGLERPEEALVFVDKALERDPDNTEAALFKALLLIDLERSDDLYAVIRSIYPAKKNDERVLCVAALYASIFGNARQAFYLLKKALKANRYSVLQSRLFYTVMNAIGKEEEITDFGTEALDYDEGNPEVWLALAQAYAHLGNDNAADNAFETLSCLIRFSEEMKFQWLRVLINKQDYDRAFDLLRTLPENQENWWLILQQMFQGMYEAGMSGKALEYAGLLRSEYKKSAETRFICDTILNKDRNEGCPLTLIRMMSDGKAREMSVSSSDPTYRLPVLLEKMLEKIREPVAGSLQVLDLGCGTGAMAAVLENYSRPAGSLTGADISSGVLKYASDLGKYANLKEADLISFCRERENAKRYDLIVCMNVLSDFADLTPVFKAVKAALKDDGVFVFSVLPLTGDNLFYKFDSGLFYHSADYVSARLKSARLEEVCRQDGLMYRKNDPCLIFAARRMK